MRDPRERILDMLEAIDRIEQKTGGGRSSFRGDELIQVWVVHHLEILGEAAARLGAEYHRAHPEIPWPRIIAMRNILVHEYFGIDVEEVWQVVTKDLPPLKALLAVLSALPQEPEEPGDRA